jgi:hypothetical protein
MFQTARDQSDWFWAITWPCSTQNPPDVGMAGMSGTGIGVALAVVAFNWTTGNPSASENTPLLIEPREVDRAGRQLRRRGHGLLGCFRRARAHEVAPVPNDMPAIVNTAPRCVTVSAGGAITGGVADIGRATVTLVTAPALVKNGCSKIV